MKKVITLSTLLLFTLSSAYSQEAIVLGAKGGLNVANISGEDNPVKLAPHLGGYLQIMFNESYGIVPEALLSWQGHGKADDGTDNQLNLTYLNIPIMFKYNVRYDLNMQAGPQLGFMLSGKSKFTNFAGQTIENDITEFWNAVDLGLALGLDYYFLDQYHAYLRYVLGLSNGDASGSTTRRNNVLQFGVGINLIRINQ